MALMDVSYRLFLMVILVFTSHVICASKTDELTSKTKKLTENLIKFVNNATNFISMQKEFNKTSGTFSEIKASDLLNEYVTKLEEEFDEKKKYLKRVKKKAEEAYETQANKSDEENMDIIKEYDYPNMRDVNITLVINPTFSLKVKVDMNKSYVHVPTNIYAKSDQVKGIARWTEELDNVFLENFENSSKTLLYQYYGHYTGFLRVYPGNNNNISNASSSPIDLYDCRRRPWYVQSTSSPKDLVIIIDLSGSMIGSKIGIAKIATASLIDTLEENDFFNVIAVNKAVPGNVYYLEPCLKYLLQGTKRNKERIKKLVQSIPVPEAEMDPIAGLTAAFELLNSDLNMTVNRSYANCNRAIVFITDGIESDYIGEKTVFEEFNSEKSTRIFTYLVGRKKSPNKEALLRMSCENNGYFYKLETLGNVWDTVLEYLHVMSRPLAVERNNEKALFTPVYLDSTGLGMVVSISMPVFNSLEFIGVAGTDVTIRSLNDAIPHSQLATFGHAFIITNNGFILMHPEFQLQAGRLPSPPNILLEDLERAVEIENIIGVKRNMIDGMSSTNDNENKFPVYFVYDNTRKLSRTNATYSYRNINESDLSAGLVVSERETSLFNFEDEKDKLLLDGIKALKGDKDMIVQVSPWNYLNITAEERDTQPYSIKVYPTATEIFESLKNATSWDQVFEKVASKISRVLVKNLLISAAIANRAWNPKDVDDSYESVFVATAAGFSKFSRVSNMKVNGSRSSTVYERDVLKSVIFQHAFANPLAKVIFSAPYSEPHHRFNVNLITAVAPIRRKDEKNKDNILAVTGMTFKAELMFDQFEKSMGACASNTSEICALLDQNGYIISSNQGPEYIGSFIGEQSGLIVDVLKKHGVLEEINLQDTQGDCTAETSRQASARVLLTPARLVLKGIVFIFRTFVRSGLQAGILMASLLYPSEQVSTTNIPELQVSCTKRMPFYLFNHDAIKKYKTLNDQNKTQICCTKMCKGKCRLTVKTVEVVPDTNLVYLMVNISGSDIHSCVEKCRNRDLVLDRVRTDKISYCFNNSDKPIIKAQKYRRQPSACFNETRSKGESPKCGAAGFLRPVSWIVIVVLSLVIVTSDSAV